jgi:hypothetical protein
LRTLPGGYQEGAEIEKDRHKAANYSIYKERKRVNMCQFKSGIVLPDKIIVPLDKDSHSEILQDLGVRDDSEFPNFVRIEYVPKDGDIFNHDPSNWELNVNQDFRPEWFNAEKTAKLMKELYMPEVFEKSFIIGKTVNEINSGRWFVKNGVIQKLTGYAIVEQMWGSSTVNQMWGSSTVNQMRESSTVNQMWGSSTVNQMWGSSTVNQMWGSSTVNQMWGSSTVNQMRESSTVKQMRESSTARKFVWNKKTQIFVPKGAFEIVEVEPPQK